VFWDVGAFIGYYSWLLKGMDNSLEVLLFEPDAVNISAIQKTLARSGLTSVHVFHAAVSDSDGEKIFSLDKITGETGTLEDPNQSFIKRHYRVDPTLINVRTITIDSVRKSARSVDLIKIDVEGHEAKVIAGAEQTILQDYPILIFENFDHNQVILDGLVGKGYRLYDAERMSANHVQTINYLALPPRCFSTSDLLLEKWREENSSLKRS
jgi:FkbM family methyltransferase